MAQIAFAKEIEESERSASIKESQAKLLHNQHNVKKTIENLHATNTRLENQYKELVKEKNELQEQFKNRNAELNKRISELQKRNKRYTVVCIVAVVSALIFCVCLICRIENWFWVIVSGIIGWLLHRCV